jgi:DNA mismatch repair protein MutL
MAGGTEVVVEHLFKHVPARRKFLRTDRTEAAHIIQTCRLLAIAHPEVAFRLIEDGHVVFDSARCPDRIQRIREILGKGRAAELFELPRQLRNGIEVSGWIGRPGVGRSTRSEMVTYVNQRPVDSRVVNYALVESYHRYLPRGRYPVAFLFIGVHDGQVDVNVHPTKREVKFRDEGQVRQAVMLTLVEALEAQAGKGLQGAVKVAGEPLDDAQPGGSPCASAVAPQPAVPLPDPRRMPAECPPEVRRIPTAPQPPVTTPGPMVRASSWRLQTVFQATFGLFETAEGWVVVHGKAAFERIWYERIEKQLRDEERASQPLLVPGIMELPPIEAGLLADQLAFFSRMGFEIEPFGRHVYRLCSAPAWLGNYSPEAFVTDLLGRIRDRGIAPGDRDAAMRVVARLAAMERSRGWQSTDRAAWQQLADDLLGCEVPLLDTRGRPTLFELRGNELRRRFMLEGERRGGMEDG